MTALERLIPDPGLVEIDVIDVEAEPRAAWAHVCHGNLGGSALIRALFALRTLPSRLHGEPGDDGALRLDDLASTFERPGFQILVDDPPHEVVVGAIGEVWRRVIPFIHLDGPEAFTAFTAPGQVKVAWAIRVTPGEGGGSTIAVEVRVGATDPGSWRCFHRYFRLIGPGSRLVRRTLLARIERALGSRERALAGDGLLPESAAQMTHAITIAAPPERIWPWLVQMGRGRGGFYSIDLLDNGGARSARELHPELGALAVGDLMPARRRGDAGFEVLQVEENRALVLGGLWDAGGGAGRPWVAGSWLFLVKEITARRSRVVSRYRCATSDDLKTRLAFGPVIVEPIGSTMDRRMLRGIRARAQGAARPLARMEATR